VVGLDILLVAVVGAALPLCLWKPWIGVLVFSWLGCMHPQRMVGGMAYDLPFSKLVAGATLLGLLFTTQRYRLPRRREVYLLAALWVTFLGSTTLTAIAPAAARVKFAEVSKIMLMTGVTLVLFQDRAKLRALLLVIALSIGLHGITGGLWGIATGFREMLFGPPGSSITDNNALGFAFTIVLPLLAGLRQRDARAPLRGLLLLAFGLTIVALFATYSRGSLVGFCLVLPLIALQVRAKDLALLGTAVAACLVIYLAPRHWVERMRTITPTAYRTESSGIKRMHSWYVAYRLGLDHPLLGSGFHPFVPAVYERYLPGYADDHDAHNHFLQVFAEHGLTGLLLFVALLVSVVIRLWQLTRATRGDPRRAWIAGYAQMIGIAVIAFVAGGVFVNMPYSDLYFTLVAAVVVLQEIAGSADGNACAVVGERLAVTAPRRLLSLLRPA
jgi:putative inorganic carbon (hco3(-)) transporter